MRAVGISLGLCVLAGAVLALAGALVRPGPPADRPIAETHAGYVSSDTCQACHPEQYESWHASYHRTMTQVAGPEAVLAPFDDRELELYGVRYAVEREGDRFFVTEDLGGTSERRLRVLMTTGSHHFQAYWIETGYGRQVRLFPWAYQIAESRWMPFDTLPLMPAKPKYRQWRPDVGGRWNWTCVQCHTTAARPKVVDVPLFDTRVVEFGIACEACHGEAAEHVRLNRNPLRRYLAHLEGDPDPTIVQPERLSHERSTEVCATCHSAHDEDAPDIPRWSEHGDRFRPGMVLEETRLVQRSDGEQTLHDDVSTAYWLDGTPRVNSREYIGLLRSPCYQRGEMSCLSCHSMHRKNDDPRPLREWADDQLSPDMDGSNACVQCHPAFETAAARTAHSHHAEGSPGNDCMNCHMPHTAWGLQKASRNHQVDSPDVRVSLETGRPNACNLCHLDRPLGWAATHLEDWYGIAEPALDTDQRELAAGVHWLAAGDAGQRALIAWHMGWAPARRASGESWLPPYLALSLLDPYPTVRSVALRALRSHERYAEVDAVYFGEREQRRQAIAATRRIFVGNGAARDRAGSPAILIGPDGDLDQQAYWELVARRNERDVALLE